ncbi:MAG: carboxypeptidase-like regulatory domain-containing protein [Vicinamibacteraceae bacterium]
MSSLLPIVLLTAAVAGHAPVSHARQPQGSRARSTAPAPTRAPGPAPVMITASLASGWIEGIVTDDRSLPISGAAVTAQGRDLLIIETDRVGRFELRGIPAGTYLLRVQGRGFAASRREFVQVVPSRGTHFDVQLRRAAASAMGPGATPVLAAGVGLSSTAAGLLDGTLPVAAPAIVEAESVETVPHDHSSAAWRLRHAKRSVLRETTSRIDDVSQYDDEDLWRPFARLDEAAAWTVGAGRAAASAILNGTLTGRVQLLTAGAIDQPFEAFTTDDMPAGIAFVHLAGPLSTRTTWSVEAATARGGVSSWFVGGTYATVVADAHGVEVHSSYSRQRSAAASGISVYGIEDDDRSAGGIQVVDHWTIGSRAMLDVGGRYERYDYLRDPGLFSPTITASLSPAARTWVRVTATRDMSAPGAEEFVPQAYGSLSLPPQRTFSSMVAGAPLEAQELRHLGVSLEQDIATFRVALTHFRQNVDGQLATVFDPNLAKGQRRADLSHYGVASVGDFAANGWGVGVSRPVGTHLRGGLEYRTSDVAWAIGDAIAAVGLVAPSAVRASRERMHDMTARVDAAAPRTGTRFTVACRYNTRFTRGNVDQDTPGGETRYDVQVYQGVPYLRGENAQVELVFGVGNLLRSGLDSVASLYDELLVVRPPTRVVGGVTVQF